MNTHIQKELIENAIKVNSVAEEYDLIEMKHGNMGDGFIMKYQQLLQIYGRPYDMISIILRSGEELLYCFDISSFYGKYN